MPHFLRIKPIFWVRSASADGSNLTVRGPITHRSVAGTLGLREENFLSFKCGTDDLGFARTCSIGSEKHPQTPALLLGGAIWIAQIEPTPSRVSEVV
jgi:hypothetical protein